MRRRTLLAAALAAAGCRPAERPLEGGWTDASHERGHRLLQTAALPAPARTRRVGVLVLGGGVAGLATARGFMRRGIDDVHLLELEDAAGGNSRAHRLGGMACPLGAHYLPLPTADAHEVHDWLFEIGLLHEQAGRTRPDEQHLCHSPQERLFFDGQWLDGLLPPADPGSATLAQYHRFAQHVNALRGFALPAHRARPTPDHSALDAVTFRAWLDAQGLDDERLRWYLDYCCRDDYGAGIDTVSAWAGLHYFASRHGFHPPGDEESEREAVFTWPEGNAWLTTRLAAPLGERVHGGTTVLRVTEGRHEVQVLAWNEALQQAETWLAAQAVVALPLHVAVRIVEPAPAALRAAAAAVAHAPWLVANLQLDGPLLERIGAPPSWDNVVYGSPALGYVDAMHQSLRPFAGATVLTAYHALPVAQRPALLAEPWAAWAERVLADLLVTHPDLPRRLQRIELTRWGHAMAIPRPGLRGHPALPALRARRGRLRFAHSDLAGYSVFEEAFIAGSEAASA